MASQTTDLIGAIAGTLTTISFVPQVMRVFKTKQTRDISMTMMLLFSLGVAMWVAFGYLVDSMPVVWTNAMTLVLALTIVAAKVRFDRSPK
jgi:MtN3 and saliva related transmembrane protein